MRARNDTPLESQLEQNVVAWLELQKDTWCIKVGLNGWPDRLVLIGNGAHFWLELKRENGGRLTPAQKRRIPKLKCAGEPVFVVRTLEEVVDVYCEQVLQIRRTK